MYYNLLCIGRWIFGINFILNNVMDVVLLWKMWVYIDINIIDKCMISCELINFVCE